MNVIIDTTLREGEQTPGVRFSIAEKLNIIDGLITVGVKEVELGIASPLIDCPNQLLKYCKTNHPQMTSSLWSRCREEDIRFAATLQPDILALSIPVSDLLIKEKLGKDRHWTANCLAGSIKLARKLGLTVAVGLEDATRADYVFLEQMAILAEKLGAVRIRLADTVGTSSPVEFGLLVKKVKTALSDTAISVHCHNDFGMATANAITALEKGADSADTTILGLGERCGCTRLEELAGFLALKKNLPYDMHELPPLAKYLARLTAREIPQNQPFLGNEIFTCETGLHLQALYNNPATYEPYPAELVGAERRFVLGAKAGRKAILSHLKAKGLTVKDPVDDTKMRMIRSYLGSDNCDDQQLLAKLSH